MPFFSNFETQVPSRSPNPAPTHAATLAPTPAPSPAAGAGPASAALRSGEVSADTEVWRGRGRSTGRAQVFY